MRYRNPSQQLDVHQFDDGHDDGCSVAINSTAESGLELRLDVEEMGISRVLRMLEGQGVTSQFMRREPPQSPEATGPVVKIGRV